MGNDFNSMVSSVVHPIIQSLHGTVITPPHICCCNSSNSFPQS